MTADPIRAIMGTAEVVKPGREGGPYAADHNPLRRLPAAPLHPKEIGMTDERPVTMTNTGKPISSTVADPAGRRS